MEKPETPDKAPVRGKAPMAHANRTWLQQYLSDEEITEHFYYDPVSCRHVFSCPTDKGDDELFYEARTVYANIKPKTIHTGKKPTKFWLGPWHDTGTLVIVEDIVSAIKVSRHFGAVPLFGCYLSAEQMASMTREPAIESIVIWLDSDKFPIAQEYAKTLSLAWQKPVSVVFTEDDPKALNDVILTTKVLEAMEAIDAKILPDETTIGEAV